jgi:hypothetical protein
MAVKNTKCSNPQKFTQIGIFGLKTNHLATLIWSRLRQTEYSPPLNAP